MHEYTYLIRKHEPPNCINDATTSKNNIGAILNLVKSSDLTNDIFLQILYYHPISLTEISNIADLGVDIKYDNGIVFAYACHLCADDILEHLLNEHQFDLSIHNKIINRMVSHKICDRNISLWKLMIEYGFVMSDRNINILSRDGKFEILIDILDMEHFLDKFNKFHKSSNEKYGVNFVMNELKKQTNNGIKFNINTQVLSKTLVHIARVGEISVEQVELLINLGADPTCSNMFIFTRSCCWPQSLVPLYIINNYRHLIDNSTICDALERAMVHKCNSIIELLLELQPEIDEYVLESLSDKPELVPIFMKYCTNIDRQAKSIIDKVTLQYQIFL